MGEHGKRSHPHRDYDGESKNQKRRHIDRSEKTSDDLVAYRILCPDKVIGSVIGKSGKVINTIRQDTRAKIRVVDPFPQSKERVITIFCYVKEKEEVDVDGDFHEKEPLCAAQDALLRVHAAIANALANAVDSNKIKDEREECHILVPSSQSANIIGKAGSTIKKLRHKTRTNIKVTPKNSSDPTHSCAMDFDNFVLISGESDAVKKALFSISAIMYKNSPREDIPLETTVEDTHPSIVIPSDVPMYPTSALYPNMDSIISRPVPPFLGNMSVPDLQSYADTGNAMPFYSSALPIVSGFGGSSRFQELKVRVLCPTDKIGRVIGKSGTTIKSIRQASGACIEVNDSRADCGFCIVTVTSTESIEDLKSMAVEAVLLLQAKINDEDENIITMRLLLPSKVIGCIIGKNGSIIHEIRKRTNADVRISKGDKPKCADDDEELVEVGGEAANVRDALIQIVLRLRDDVLRERGDVRNPSVGADSLYSGATSFAMPSMLPSGPQIASLGYDQRAETGNTLSMLSSRGLFGYGSLPMEENGSGSLSAYSSKMYGMPSPPLPVEILIPGNAVYKVLGKSGTNLSNIRKISGAMVEISESKSSRGDRVALISGTPEQKRSAENLIQAFIMAT